MPWGWRFSPVPITQGTFWIRKFGRNSDGRAGAAHGAAAAAAVPRRGQGFNVTTVPEARPGSGHVRSPPQDQIPGFGSRFLPERLRFDLSAPNPPLAPPRPQALLAAGRDGHGGTAEVSHHPQTELGVLFQAPQTPPCRRFRAAGAAPQLPRGGNSQNSNRMCPQIR